MSKAVDLRILSQVHASGENIQVRAAHVSELIFRGMQILEILNNLSVFTFQVPPDRVHTAAAQWF